MNYPYLYEKQVGRRFSIFGFLAFLGLLGLIGYEAKVIYTMNIYPAMTGKLWANEHGEKLVATPRDLVYIETAQPIVVEVQVNYPTQEPTPTQLPTLEPTPTGQPGENYIYVAMQYSYYYPPLGGANCSNFVNGYCHATMANGERWEDWLGRAVACPDWIPLETVIEVVEPEVLKGIWICKDRGQLITDMWLDFLMDKQVLEWRFPVLVKIFY
jgi:hypothetical protein